MIVKQSKKVYQINEKHILISIRDGKIILSKGIPKDKVKAVVIPQKIKEVA